MPSAFGGFAAGLASGIEQVDKMQARRDEIDLRNRAEGRADEELSLKQEQDRRAGRQAAIAEETGQLNLRQAKEKEQYQLERKKFLIDTMANQKTTRDDGTPIPASDLVWDRAVKVADFDMANGQISAEDQMKFAEMRKRVEGIDVKDAFAKLYARDQKGAQKFLDHLGFAKAEISQDGETFTAWTKPTAEFPQGQKIERPLGEIAAIVGSPIPAARQALEKGKQEIEYYKGRNKLYTSLAEKNAYDKHREQLNADLGGLYGSSVKGIESRLTRLEQDESAMEKDQNMLEPQKVEARKRFADRRAVIQGEHQAIQDNAVHIGTIIDAARDQGVKLDARTVAGFLPDIAEGRNVIMSDDGRVAYVRKGRGKDGKDQVIPVPESAIKRSVGERLVKEMNERKGQAAGGASAPAAPAETAAPAAAAPAAAPAPTKQAIKEPTYASFISSVPRSASVTINAPPRSVMAKLNGQKFASREEAMKAMAALSQ